MSLSELTLALMEGNLSFQQAFVTATLMSLPTRIEIEREADNEQAHQDELQALLKELSEDVLKNLDSDTKSQNLKKKT